MQGEVGGASPARPPLAGVAFGSPTSPTLATRPAPAAQVPVLPRVPVLAQDEPAHAGDAAAPTSAAKATAANPAIPLGSRPFGIVVFGGLLAVGLVLITTSSAGNGGHSPSSPTAVPTRPFRLVAPALRWRVRALAECVRPAPLVFPLELPG